MQQIIVVIDEDGNSSVDLNGFADGSCANVMKDFQGDDHLVAEHKKPEYYRQAQASKDERQQHRR
jgi:hypothetical protein